MPQIVHVRVETGTTIEVEAHSHHDDEGDGDQQRLLSVEGVVVQTVYQCKGLSVYLVFLGSKHLREINQCKERCAQYGKGGKESEVAQQVGLYE